MGWKQYAVQAEIDKQIQQSKAERTAEVLEIVNSMLKDAEYYEMHERVSWTLNELKTRIQKLQEASDD